MAAGVELLTCPMCGFRYDPQANEACPSCPLHAQCNLACCPNCGYQTVNLGRSQLAGWFQKLGLRLVPPVNSREEEKR